jgi:RNA polymerase sigma-70 factor (ECF subfamily)
VPSAPELTGRLEEVLAVLYLLFNEGYLASSRGAPSRRNLAEDAAWLTALLARLVPNEPEVRGLLGLMKLHLARGESRFTNSGQLILLADQDRTRWNRQLIAEAVGLIEGAARLRRPGPYQLEAAIAACHAEAPSLETTDWRQVVALYDMLLVLQPTPVVELNRALAASWIEGPEQALQDLEKIAPELEGYHLFHAARAQLLAQKGCSEAARAAHLRALGLTQNDAERDLLQQRLFR